jgi:hypothetical protein
MKTLNETFTDYEFQRLNKVKGSLSWHDLIMKLVIGYSGKKDLLK